MPRIQSMAAEVANKAYKYAPVGPVKKYFDANGDDQQNYYGISITTIVTVITFLVRMMKWWYPQPATALGVFQRPGFMARWRMKNRIKKEIRGRRFVVSALNGVEKSMFNGMLEKCQELTCDDVREMYDEIETGRPDDDRIRT